MRAKYSRAAESLVARSCIQRCESTVQCSAILGVRGVFVCMMLLLLLLLQSLGSDCRSLGVRSPGSCVAMPFAAQAPREQDVTFVSLEAMLSAGAGREPSSGPAAVGLQRLQQLAASQGEALPDDLDLKGVGFVLATRDQVESAHIMEESNVGVAISTTGHQTKRFCYRTSRTSNLHVDKANLSVP